jgi:hypothetical protein
VISRRDPPVLPAHHARAQAGEAAMSLFHPPPAANAFANSQPSLTAGRNVIKSNVKKISIKV